MKLNSDGTCERTRKLLAIAQLMTLAFCALGLAFIFNPTPAILFLFTSLSPVLALVAVFILVTQWIATQQIHHVVGHRASRTDTKGDPITVVGRGRSGHCPDSQERASEGCAVESRSAGTIWRIL